MLLHAAKLEDKYTGMLFWAECGLSIYRGLGKRLFGGGTNKVEGREASELGTDQNPAAATRC